MTSVTHVTSDVIKFKLRLEACVNTAQSHFVFTYEERFLLLNSTATPLTTKFTAIALLLSLQPTVFVRVLHCEIMKILA